MFKVLTLVWFLSLVTSSPYNVSETFDIEAALKFIDELEIPESPVVDDMPFLNQTMPKPRGGADAANAAKGKAFIVAGGTASFTPSVTAANQADVKNSFLLAQLAANHAHDRYNDFTNWYKFFVNVLNNIGWIIHDFHFTQYSSKGTTVNVDKGLLDLLLALTQPEVGATEVLQETLKALKNLNPNSSSFKLWEDNTTKANNGNFQTCVCWQNGSNVGIGFAGMYFKSNAHRGNFLWFSWASHDIQLFQTGDSLILNEQVYANVRGAVVQKLGKNAVTFVNQLVI